MKTATVATANALEATPSAVENPRFINSAWEAKKRAYVEMIKERSAEDGWTNAPWVIAVSRDLLARKWKPLQTRASRMEDGREISFMALELRSADGSSSPPFELFDVQYLHPRGAVALCSWILTLPLSAPGVAFTEREIAELKADGISEEAHERACIWQDDYEAAEAEICRGGWIPPEPLEWPETEEVAWDH